MSTAIILCSRAKSSRVPNKCFLKYADVTHIEHLVKRLIPSEIPIYIATPSGETYNYMFLLDRYPKKVFLSEGFDKDPLARIHAVAKQNNIDTIVRVTHDKMFVDPTLVNHFVGKFKEKNLDYLYSSDFIPGTGFEVISFKVIEEATKKFKNIEHISYAVKALTDNKLNLEIGFASDVRLLVDYPEDVQLMDILFSSLGADCTLPQVLEYINENPWLRSVNRLPDVTVYTCAYNAEKWITEAMGSVALQENFKNYEYILIDDYSKDKTLYHIGKFCQTYKNAKFFKNVQNIGLASSSNRALKLARGKYIIRLDADDYFSSRTSVADLITEIESRDLDVVYPSCYVGVARKSVQKGDENHHCGGTLYKTAALNHVKFTDRLRNFEGLDVFVRAKDQLKIGYLNKPTFVYRQHPNSMSKTNLKEREETKRQILDGVAPV